MDWVGRRWVGSEPPGTSVGVGGVGESPGRLVGAESPGKPVGDRCWQW